MNRQSAFTAQVAPNRAVSGTAADLSPALEAMLVEVEAHLAALGEALRERDLGAVDDQSAQLHRSLARAVDQFSRAARSGPIPLALRHRLASTSGHVAAQRESFARATAALDRAIDVLLPRETPALYGAYGGNGRGTLGGSAQA